MSLHPYSTICAVLSQMTVSLGPLQSLTLRIRYFTFMFPDHIKIPDTGSIWILEIKAQTNELQINALK